LEVQAAILIGVVSLDKIGDFCLRGNAAHLGCLGDEARHAEVVHLVLDRIFEHIEPLREDFLCFGHQPFRLRIGQRPLRDVFLDRDLPGRDNFVVLQTQLLHVNAVLLFLQDLLSRELKLEIHGCEAE